MVIDKYDLNTVPIVEQVKEENIPKELKEVNQWTLWRWQKGAKKWTKPPVSVEGFQVDHTKCFLSFDEVLKAHREHPELGIGFSLRKTDKFCGIDFDNVLHNGKPKPEFAESLKILQHAGYCEISPSGQGLRVFGIGLPETLGSRKGSIIEVYSHGRYLTVTGNSNGASGKPLINIEKLCVKISSDKVLNNPKVLAQSEILAETPTSTNTSIIIDALQVLPAIDYDDWIKVGMAIHHESRGSDAAFFAWSLWSSKFPDKFDTTGQECRNKWRSFGKHPGEPVTVGTVVELLQKYKKKVKYKTSELIDWIDLDAKKLPAKEYIVNKLFPTYSINMVHAKRGLGKTNFCLGLAMAITTGKPFLKWSVPKARRVLYIDGELPLVDLQFQAKLASSASGCRPERGMLSLFTPDLLKNGIMRSLTDPINRNAMDRHIDNFQPSLVIIDSLATCFTGLSEDQKAWEDIQPWILKLRANGISVLFVHHDEKSGKAQRGFSNKEDVMNTVLHLQNPEGYESSQGAVMSVVFSKQRGLWGDDVKTFEAKLEKLPGSLITKWTWGSEITTTNDAILDLIKSGMSQRDIAQELGVSQKTISRINIKAVDDGLLPKSRVSRAVRREFKKK